jgi:alginate O-acetyltransferase complex protein AlgI
MLFNSYQFVFLFLPVVVIIFFVTAKFNYYWAAGYLGIASLLFYSSWHYQDLYLLLPSIAWNYSVGYWLSKISPCNKKKLLILAIAANLIVLGYFKYANFFVDNVNSISSWQLSNDKIALPLGISFFTFTQIAYLVDSYLGKVKEFNLIHYLLFVTYFPHLIAGPILHHHDTISQFQQRKMYRWNSRNVMSGLLLFTIGLFKKVILADGVVGYITPVFNAAKQGIIPSFGDSWLGALAYTVQLYFDFSGYSDMAIGLSLLFNIKLPINFNSPYQSVNITEFWRRWHITLSNFLRDYLYIPLGGNRHGQFRRYLNLLITMLIGGLWHGAGWTFILWGGLHGIYLVIHHSWQSIRKKLGQDLSQSSWWGRLAGRAITFIAVVIAWVLFRSETLTTARLMLKSMFTIPPIDNFFKFEVVESPMESISWTISLLCIAWFMPNSQSLIRSVKERIDPIHLSNKYGSGRDRFKQDAIAGADGKLFDRIESLPKWLQAHEVWHYWIIGFTLPLIFLLVAISESQSIKEFIYFNF